MTNMNHLQQDVLNALEELNQRQGQDELSNEDFQLLLIASLLEEASNAS